MEEALIDINVPAPPNKNEWFYMGQKLPKELSEDIDSCIPCILTFTGPNPHICSYHLTKIREHFKSRGLPCQNHEQ